MKQVPYSPFNRSYKYICLQNQLAHNKNKKSVKGLTDSNLIVGDDLFRDSKISLSKANNSGRSFGNKSMYSNKSLADSRHGKLK